MRILKIALGIVIVLMVVLVVTGYYATKQDTAKKQVTDIKAQEQVTTTMVARQQEYAKSEGVAVTQANVQNSQRMDDLISNLTPIEKDTISRLLATNETYLTQTSVIDYIQVENASSEKAGVIVGVIYNQVGRTGESAITMLVINSTDKDFTLDMETTKVSYKGKEYGIRTEDPYVNRKIGKQSIEEITYIVDTKGYTEGQLPYDETTDIYMTGKFADSNETYYMVMKPTQQLKEE